MKQEAGSILVVDDSRLIRKMLSSKLKENLYDVKAAEDGQEALELIGKGAFDIVLLDIVMPDTSGIEVLEAIRKTHSMTELPVIMVTAQDETEEIVNTLSLGANDYITKPVDMPVVLARIKTQLTLKRSDEALKKYSKELEHSNRLKDLFIDIMGHDLLKPAEIASLSAEFMLDKEKDPDKTKILQNILQSQVRIIDMIENASILAKLESGERLEYKKCDLDDILRSAAEELTYSAIEKGMQIKINADGETPSLVNPLIHDVFSNILGNAVKYGPSGSEVTAEITNNNGCWRISVADRGPGIPDEHKEAIFDRFKRLEKGAVKGSGLGLAIVKKVVEAHEGRCWVEDRPGGGSIFYVDLAAD